MTRTVRSAFVLLLFVLSSVLSFPAATVLAVDQKIPAIVPAPQTAGWWMPQHERNMARVRQGSVDLLMIGTNNYGTRKDPPEETGAGVQAIVTLLRARLPETNIILLGSLPLCATSSGSIRRLNGSINDRLRGFAAGQHLFYLDFGHLFWIATDDRSETSCRICFTPMNRAIACGLKAGSAAQGVAGRVRGASA